MAGLINNLFGAAPAEAPATTTTTTTAVEPAAPKEDFNAGKAWKRAGRKVKMVNATQSEIEVIKKKFQAGLAFPQLVRSNFRGAIVTRPEIYLEASFEVFELTMALTWILTYIANPGVIWKNRINDIFGYNNVCVGFDTAPARFLAQPLFALQSFLGIRYGTLDLLRLNLEWKANRVSKWQYRFSATMNCLFMFTMLLWPMLLIITPDGGGAALNYHFYVYVIFVVIMYLTILAQFTETPTNYIPKMSLLWVRTFGVWTLGLLLVGFVGFNGYDYEMCPSDNVSMIMAENMTNYEILCQQGGFVPWGFMALLDWGWFILLAPTTFLLPYSPALNIPVHLIIDDQNKPAGALATFDIDKGVANIKEKAMAIYRRGSGTAEEKPATSAETPSGPKDQQI
jgi:hypothetical protein